MKKFSVLKIISLIFVCALLMGAIAITAFADTQEPDVKIAGKNIYFSDVVQLEFAVTSGATVKAVCGEADVEIEKVGTVKLNEEGKFDENGTAYDHYRTVSGWAPQNIDAIVTVTATLGEKTTSMNYSVLMYLHERLHLDAPETVSDKQRAVYNALMAYAEATDALLNETPKNFGDFVYVEVVNGTLDGFNTWGMFKAGDKPFADNGCICYF
jgi:hypothetical protein